MINTPSLRFLALTTSDDGALLFIRTKLRCLLSVPYRFSITKWIHLNEGDEGVRKLFRRAFDTLRAGGVFIVEPQEWETYAKARRMDPVSPLSSRFIRNPSAKTSMLLTDALSYGTLLCTFMILSRD